MNGGRVEKKHKLGLLTSLIALVLLGLPVLLFQK